MVLPRMWLDRNHRRTRQEMKVLFVQFANSMFPRFEASDGYWDEFYRHYHGYGYWRMEDAFEVPKWIAEVCFFLPRGCERKICWVHHSVQEAIDEIESGGYNHVFFSVMTCTKDFTNEIIRRTSDRQCYIIGGYDGWIYEAQRKYPNVHTMDTMRDTATFLGVPYRFGTDYSLFRGWTVLPRLTLSSGCLNNCRFCIIPHRLEEVDESEIMQQADSFRDLEFRLVYIDDKTFGQARNYRMLSKLGDRIRSYNPDFVGFVIQTTSPVLVEKAREFHELGVAVAEIGFETGNDFILKKYRKPSTTHLASRAIDAGTENGINVIVNIIVGFPEENDGTYANTMDFMRSHADRIFGYNMAIYTDYSADDNLGEVDFRQDVKTEMHRKHWNEINRLATHNILKHKPICIK